MMIDLERFIISEGFNGDLRDTIRDICSKETGLKIEISFFHDNIFFLFLFWDFDYFRFLTSCGTVGDTSKR